MTFNSFLVYKEQNNAMAEDLNIKRCVRFMVHAYMLIKHKGCPRHVSDLLDVTLGQHIFHPLFLQCKGKSKFKQFKTVADPVGEGRRPHPHPRFCGPKIKHFEPCLIFCISFASFCSTYNFFHISLIFIIQIQKCSSLTLLSISFLN